MKTQKQMYYAAVRSAGEVNEFVMDEIRAGRMTGEDLKKLINKFPGRYDRFAGLANNLIKTKKELTLLPRPSL